MAQDKAVLQEVQQELESAPAPTAEAAAKAASDAVQQLDTSSLTEEDKKAIQDFVQQIDINNTDHVLLFGADAQKKIADFSDSALATVRTNDTAGKGRPMLVKKLLSSGRVPLSLTTQKAFICRQL